MPKNFIPPAVLEVVAKKNETTKVEVVPFSTPEKLDPNAGQTWIVNIEKQKVITIK